MNFIKSEIEENINGFNSYLHRFKDKFKEDNNFQSIIFLLILFPIFIIFVFVNQGFTAGVSILINGLIGGSSLALLALGFSIIFGVARMFKLSLGGYFVMGAYALFWLDKVSQMNVNGILDRKIINNGSLDFTILFLRMIHAFPFFMFLIGLVFLFIKFDKIKSGYLAILHVVSFLIQRNILVVEYGKVSQLASFQAIIIVSSIILFSIGLKYFELSDLQVLISATILNSLLLAINYTNISTTVPGLYLALFLYSIMIVASVSMLVDRYLLDEVRKNPTNILIVTFGIALFIQSILAEFTFPIDRDPDTTEFEAFGIETRAINGIVLKTDNFMITIGDSDIVIQSVRFVAMIFSIILVTLAILFINKTQMGLAMKAVSQDEDAAWLVGIDVRKVYVVATGLGMGLTAAAGMLITPYDARPFSGIFMGWFPLVLAIAVVTVGGLGSIVGTVTAGFLIGFAQAYVNHIDPQQAIIVPFVIIFIVMLIRPEGLFGIPEENQ